MKRVTVHSITGRRPAELVALICAGARGGNLCTVYLDIAGALRLADELDTAAHDLLAEERNAKERDRVPPA